MQGRASSSGPAGQKVEPRVHEVSPKAVNQIGTSLGNHATGNGQILPGASRPLYPGREGFTAPMNESQSHHRGSQGRHE